MRCARRCRRWSGSASRRCSAHRLALADPDRLDPSPPVAALATCDAGIVDIDDIRTPSGIVVPDTALTWRFSRSSAPGGQHVNTSSTKVELRCEIAMLPVSDAVRERLLD